MHLVHPPRFSIKLESNPPDAFAETGFVKHNVPIAGCRPAVPALQLKQADVICPCTTCGIVGSPSLALCRSCFRTYCSLARSRTSCSLAAPAPSLLPPLPPQPARPSSICRNPPAPTLFASGHVIPCTSSLLLPPPMADYEATVLGGALAFQLSAAFLTSSLNFFIAHEPIPTGRANCFSGFLDYALLHI